MPASNYTITPEVDAVREFLEISGDFTNPLEIVREAISNSIDAGADNIYIEFSAKRLYGNHVLEVSIKDDGSGMNSEELQSFFDLGNSRKRHDAGLIGEKGHGTKVFFNCTQISVATIKNGTLLTAEMDQPFSTLHDGRLPLAKVNAENSQDASGTLIVIKGFNNNQGELFTHDRLRDYVKWFTKFASCEDKFGVSLHSKKRLHLKGLDSQQVEIIEFGHEFPDESPSMQKLFSEHVVRAPDYFCRRITKEGKLRRHPFISYQAIFSIEGNRIKHNYNKMIRRPGYTPPEGAYTVQERYGLWLCKDFWPAPGLDDTDLSEPGPALELHRA